MANEFVLTKRGKKELEEKLEYLKTTRRAEISEAIKVARSFGDLSENAEYTEARNEQSRNEGESMELEQTLMNATIVDDDEINIETVGVGAKVRLMDMEDSSEDVYKLLGTTEADAMTNCISNESPVGRAIMGHSVGDVVTVNAPGGEYKYKIMEIAKA